MSEEARESLKRIYQEWNSQGIAKQCNGTDFALVRQALDRLDFVENVLDSLESNGTDVEAVKVERRKVEIAVAKIADCYYKTYTDHRDAKYWADWLITESQKPSLIDQLTTVSEADDD